MHGCLVNVINPYQAPIAACTSPSDNRRVWIALVPFFVTVMALISTAVVLIGRPFPREVEIIVIGILGTVLVFDVPTCVYVLVKWLRDGVPPDLISELMMSAPEEREFHRNLRTRPKLDENAFFEVFYAPSGVPKNLVVQLRDLLESVTGYDLAGLHPRDNLVYIDGEMDFADVLYRIERDFSAKLDWDELRRSELTFDFLLRAIVRASTHSDRLAEISTTDG